MGDLKSILNKNVWISILESIIYAIIGFILVFNPTETVRFCAYILGIIFICSGVYKIINYVLVKGKNDFYDYNLFYGIIAIAIGIVTMIYSNAITSIFRIIIGIWIIYSSAIRMSYSIKLKNMDVNIWIYSIILSIIMFSCGIYIISSPGIIMVTIGIIIIAYSVIDIIENIILMKNINGITK